MTTWLQCLTTRKKLWLAGAVVLSASTFSGYAHPQDKPADASKFDIGGVILYMSGNEAEAALKRHYGAKIKIGVTKSACQYKPSAQCVREITYQDGAYNFSAKFVEEFPRDDTRPESVYSIEYDVNIRATEADRLQLQKSAVEKYGPATVAEPANQNPPPYLTWCALRPPGPIVAGGVVQQNARRTGTDVCDPEKPIMSWRKFVGTLVLSDQTYFNKTLDAYQHSTTGKPTL